MLSSSAPSKVGTRVLTISQRASGPSLQSMIVAAPIARNDARKSPREAKKIASRPSAAPRAVYRCTPHAQAVRNFCVGNTRGRLPAAPDVFKSFVRLVVARPEVFFEHRHERSARAIFLYEYHRFFERHLPIRAQKRNRQRRCAIHSGVAMQIDARARLDQIAKVMQRDFEPLGHRVRAAILDRSPHVIDPLRSVLRAKPAVVQPVHAQVIVVLQIVNRGNPVGVLEPGDISLTRIFSDQQLVRDYADRRSPSVASRARSVVGAFAEPINHGSNVTIRAVSIPDHALAWSRGCSAGRSSLALARLAALVAPFAVAVSVSLAGVNFEREPEGAMTEARIRSA